MPRVATVTGTKTVRVTLSYIFITLFTYTKPISTHHYDQTKRTKKNPKSHIKVLGLCTNLHCLSRILLPLQTHHTSFPYVTKFNLSVRRIWTV